MWIKLSLLTLAVWGWIFVLMLRMYLAGGHSILPTLITGAGALFSLSCLIYFIREGRQNK